MTVSQANPVSFVRMHRELIASAIGAEIKARYAGSILGRGWLVLSPILLLLVYTIVYVYIFRLRPTNMTLPEYVLHIFAGLVTYLGLAEGISAGMISALSNKTVLRGTAFPAALIPVKSVLSSQVGYLVGMFILVLASAAIGTLGWGVLLLPLVMAIQISFLVGVAWFTSLINIIVRDLQHAITYILMILMILSPIAYTLDMVPNQIRFAVLVNPIAHFVFMAQSVLTSATPPNVSPFLVCTLLTWLVVHQGFRFFQHTKAVVTEYA